MLAVLPSTYDNVAARTPFIYNPSEAKRQQQTREDASQVAAQWICGEVATVEVEIWNPTSQEFEVIACQ